MRVGRLAADETATALGDPGRTDEVMPGMVRHGRVALGCAIALAGSALMGCTSAKDSASLPTASPAFPIHTSSMGPPAGHEKEIDGPGVERCTITTVGMIRRHFGAKGISETVSTTGIGSRVCHFFVRSSNLGVGGVVSVTVYRHSSRAELAAAARSVPRATAVAALGDRAFYTAKPAALQFVRAGKRVAVRADLHVPAGPQPRPEKLRADIIGIGKAIVKGL